MDAHSRAADHDPLSVTGLGAVEGACDPTPWLRQRKLRKFMGRQDDLAVVGAARALESAGLADTALGERAGLYLTVGYIPFEADEIDALHAASSRDGRFSMRRFATEGYLAPNPLLTFRCLPNMPAFHVSVNFEVQGPYLVTYPGAGQLYTALEAAGAALAAGTIDVALVGGVADQRNFLVEHHARRLGREAGALRDAAGFLVLETAAHATARGAVTRARWLECASRYRPWDPFTEAPDLDERFEDAGLALRGLGAASLPVGLARLPAGRHRHRLAAGDGIEAASTWEIA
jgi:3-oxoacyl-(acyl-carrier-protein) synthase